MVRLQLECSCMSQSAAECLLLSFAEAEIYALRLADKIGSGSASRVPAQLQPYQTRQDGAVRHCDGRPAPDVRWPRAALGT